MRNNLIFCGLIYFLITFYSFSAAHNSDMEQPVRSAKEKLSEVEIFEKFSLGNTSALNGGPSQQALSRNQSSIEEGQCKLKLVCYKCCVGEGPAKECDNQFHNWKKGKDCGCK